MKKLLTLFFALMCATSIFAAKYDCYIDGIYYNLNKETLTATVTNETGDDNAHSYSGSVRIPAKITYKKKTYSVTTIGDYAFSDCTNLSSITCYAPNPPICTNSCFTNVDKSIPICVHSTSISAYTRAEGWKNFIEITCLNNEIIYTASSKISETTSDLYQGFHTNAFNTTITSHEFSNGVGIITFFNDVTRIGENAFLSCKLTSITIPRSVKTIGKDAFSWCDYLTSITIPTSVTQIDERAFYMVYNLIYKGTATGTPWGAKCRNGYIDGYFVYSNESKTKLCGCLADTEGSIIIPNSVTSIGKYAFSGCSRLTSITIPNSVTTIGESAFSGCLGLTSITIPNSVTSIGKYAFGDCRGLTSITIPNSVTTIEHGAFVHCSGLTSITIPNSVTTIEETVFGWCSSLTSVTIPNSVTTIGFMAFYDCSSLTSVTIPNSVTTIEGSAFTRCTKLTSVTIGNSVTEIKWHAFKGCTGLTSVTIPNSVTTIRGGVFEDCSIQELYCSENLDLENNSQYIAHIYRLSEQDLLLRGPFPQYAQNYVESRINQWQKKGDYEKTADWQKRVNETTRKQKVNEYVKDAEKQYLAGYAKRQSFKFTLGKYDPDNEVFLVKENQRGDLLVSVPIADAQYVGKNWSSCSTVPHYVLAGTDVVLQSIDFTFPNKKTYTYKPSQNLTYAQADIQYNFDPIEIDLGSNTSAPQPKGQQTIQQKQISIGKSAVDTNIPQTGANNTKTFVIILANEDYESVASVPFAKNDGNTFKKYCINTLGIPEKNIHLRENATLNNMRSELGWLKQVCEAYKGETSVIFYYAGHGIPDENDKSAYLLPTDGDGRYVQSGYKLDDLYKNLGSMLAKSVTVFMDACFSGSQRGSGMLASARGIALKSKAGVPQGNMVVFSAAQGDETAYPNNEQGHGMFTYYLLKKLQETKGDVTLKDLGDYITTNVSQQSIVINSKSQTPCVTPASAVADSWQSWKLR